MRSRGGAVGSRSRPWRARWTFMRRARALRSGSAMVWSSRSIYLTGHSSRTSPPRRGAEEVPISDILSAMSWRLIVAVIGAVVLAAGGVACIVLGLRTHPAVEINGVALPPQFVRQVGAQSFGHPVQVGRNGWQIAAGCLLMIDGCGAGRGVQETLAEGNSASCVVGRVTRRLGIS